MLGFYDIFYLFVLFTSLYFLVFWLLVSLDRIFGEQEKSLKKLIKFPLVSIAIPAYNEEKRILKTMQCVVDLDYPTNKIELFIMDDGSKDDTKKIVKEFIKKNKEFNIKLISKPNRGKGAVINDALKMANGEYFVIFDADSTIQGDALRIMLPHFEDKEVAAVLPVIKVRNPRTLIERFQWIEYLATFFYKYAMYFLDSVPVTPGPFSVFKRKILIDIGGFSENNLTEDLEMSLRLQKHHYRLLQVLNVVSYTSAPNTILKFYNQRNRWYKGGLTNSLKYRKMMFNRQYGDFGMMEFPSFLATGILIAILFFLGIVRSIGYGINFIENLIEIDFDILSLFRDFNFHWFSLSYPMLLLGLLAMFFATILLVWSHQAHNEKIFKYGWFVLPIYLLIYGLFVMTIWLGVFIDFIFKRKQKW
jgi:cellulose synthase/poly-beta-1,6-N-acetylglucosamine synthase-like glycosyltransferase